MSQMGIEDELCFRVSSVSVPYTPRRNGDLRKGQKEKINNKYKT